jgi:hypothetical protein
VKEGQGRADGRREYHQTPRAPLLLFWLVERPTQYGVGKNDEKKEEIE